MPFVFQERAQRLLRVDVVLDDEHRAGWTAIARRPVPEGVTVRIRAEWQADRELAALSGPIAVSRNTPAVQLDEPVHERETDSQASGGVRKGLITLREE